MRIQSSPNHDETCLECGRSLNKQKIEWLHASVEGFRMYDVDELPDGLTSQGWFAFGSACAKNVLKQSGKLTRHL